MRRPIVRAIIVPRAHLRDAGAGGDLLKKNKEKEQRQDGGREARRYKTLGRLAVEILVALHVPRKFKRAGETRSASSVQAPALRKTVRRVFTEYVRGAIPWEAMSRGPIPIHAGIL